MGTSSMDGARVTSQFRERHNMTYELDCGGTPIVVRVFPLEDSESWRVEVRRNDAPETTPIIAIASAATREAALQEIRQWCDENRGSGLSLIDWPAVTRALASVRAL